MIHNLIFLDSPEYVFSIVISLLLLSVFVQQLPNLYQACAAYLSTHLLRTHSLHCYPQNSVLMREIEEMPLFIEDTISQELIHLFHDTTMAQNYHFLSAPSNLPAEYGIPLRLTLAHIPECTLSLLHLHGFHTFVTHISPKIGRASCRERV